MHHILDAIGRTPLVRLRRLVPPGSASIYVKLEYYNPTGSYKDRMALAMIQGAEARGALRPGMTVLECTGGSTGSSLAFVCAVKGYPFVVISSDAYAREKLDTMTAFGAELQVEPSVGGVVTPDLWPRMLARAARIRAARPVYYTDQFNNPDAAAGYAGIGEEIALSLPRVDAFCGMVGTAGMITGAGRAIRAAHPDARIVAIEPASSAVLSGQPPGAHGIDGTGAGFVPPQLDRAVAREVRVVEEARARALAARLAQEEGVFAGTSTGGNVAIALDLAAEVGPGGVVVTVACDSGLKYLSRAQPGRE